ncbi:hypothetical protein SNE40_006024 [Patella caerulea]|uniref:Uncharacterized protein n=1 Tax=Patella caerulea TaxID=87958 RepID=A0AAN8PVK1_PATCE
MVGFGKEKDCESINPWIRSITNHMYWCAASRDGDESTQLVRKWRSVVNHIQNDHNETIDAAACLHESLEGKEKKKKWLELGSQAMVKLEKVLTNKRLENDIKK